MEYQNTTEWTWQVIFTDGGTLDEYVDGVHTHAYADIQREMDAGRQVRFMVLKPNGRPDLQPVTVAIQPGERPIFFRRGVMPFLTFGSDVPDPPYTLHGVGIRRPGQGKRGMSFVLLYSDGRVLFTTSRNEV